LMKMDKKKVPVMLHRALFGSLERFAGILIEHYAGHLPFWLSPTQVVITTITSDTDEYAKEVKAALQKLSATELRLCLLLRLDLSSKEIASVLRITPDSVRVARYRLRKKLPLEREDELVNFMLKL